ncbi:DUF11 domain-containing protein [Desulfosarcina widdelii]|uniref:DUF11 domain-containing protein n=1 Tax=Desulfosarcina widdelii TaxID=947919 RepID=UPI001478AB71|nr:DUF11 domain-containing protein [Desulfosarcina widdelii]
MAGFFLAMLLVAASFCGTAGAVTSFTNSAELSGSGGVISSASVTAWLSTSTSSNISFHRYAPSATGATIVTVPTTSSSTTGGTSGGTQSINQIYAVGSSTPIDLSVPVPLVETATYHQNEPVFIQVVDGDQDQDPTTAETVWVLVSVPASGEIELLLLTESGPNTGVFVGYIQSSGSGTVTAFNGVLNVAAEQSVTAQYADSTDSTDAASTTALVDPYGIVFDSSSGDPLDGVELTLIDVSTGQPATVYGDDGISSFPATITSGGTVTDSSGRTYSFSTGEFRFPFVSSGSYRIEIDPPDGYQAPSTVSTAELQALPGSPFAILDPGSRGEAFIINPDASVNLDIPVDPLAGTLWLRKSVSEDAAAIGDFLQYTLDLENTDTQAANGVVIIDRLPLGFRYQDGSVRLDGERMDEPAISANGRTLTFSPGTLAAGDAVEVRYVVEVAAGIRLGENVNTATAADDAGNGSNTATATVQVKEDLFRSTNTIVGRVIADNCGDLPTEAADGVEGIRIYMEDGTFVITDKQGMYHFEGVSRGSHVVQLDVDSLPDSVEMFACEKNNRHAGTPWSQFVDMQGGTLWRADFHVVRKPGVDPDTPVAGRDRNPGCGQPYDDSPAVVTEEQVGILAPLDGSRLVNSVNAVRVRLDARLTPRLLLDGKEVSKKRIGFTLKDPGSKYALYSYIGVDFGPAGEHTLEVQGIGPFGNARFKQTCHVVRTGRIAAIRLLQSEGNVADGKTPVTLNLQLLDGRGQPIHAPAELEIRDGNLKPCRPTGDDLSRQAPAKSETVSVTADGQARFAPVSASGRYRISLGYNDAVVDAEIYVQPFLREWIIVGLAEGTTGYNTLSGNMENLSDADEEEKFYQDGRVAFFAKGKVRGKWLLTLAYDSEKNRDDPDNELFQTIDPDAYYTLYGDATTQQYDAASIRKLYVKLEREQFYLLFGDYDTGLTVTELSKYSRSLNGLKTEFAGRVFSFNGFASETNQAYVKDEIRGDGTSGLYRLTRSSILINSETVTIETRDRYKSDVILSTQNLTRHVDYSIDYDDGTLFFKSPVYSRDDDLNPVYIVVEYESDDRSDDAVTYGGRGAARMLDGRVEVGATYIHEGPTNADGDLGGTDITVKVDEKNSLKAEFAATRREETGDTLRDQAWLAEWNHHSEKTNARLYAREQGEAYGLGQQNASETGTRKLGVEADYRFNRTVTVSADLYRRYDLDTDAERDMGESRATYDNGDYRLYSGFRLAEDRLSDGSTDRSNMLLAGASRSFYENRLGLRLDHEQLVSSGDNSSDYPTRTLFGADFRLTDRVSLFGEQELTWGSDEDTQTTQAGVRATPWRGGQLGTSVGREYSENSRRVFANLGLDQTWQISERWSLDGGFERSHTLDGHSDAGSDSFADDDFTALSLGAGYRADVWSWTSRAETRFADDEKKWNLLCGFIVEPMHGLGLSAGLQLNITDAENGQDDAEGDLRLSLAWRPKNTRWIVLDRLEYKFDRIDGTSSDSDSQRIVNNLNLNFKPDNRLQLSGQYGAKFVLATFDDDTYTGFTDLIGLEARYDITRHWDIGLRTSVLHSWNAGQVNYSAGASVGYAIVKNAWLSVGYNFIGFEDEDFSQGSYTAQGPFVQFRFKFDQQTVREMVDWFGGRTR